MQAENMFYLRKSYGDSAAFLFGWQRFIVAGSASIASLGVGFSIFMSTVIQWGRLG